MDITLHALAADTFLPMLKSLSGVLDKGAQFAKAKNFDPAVLVNARLAPDMFPLSKQVQFVCMQACNATAGLMGKEAPKFADDEKTIEELKARIAKAIDYVKSAEPGAFAGGEKREFKFPLPDGKSEIVLDGLQFLKEWTLPHFYFHLVTAYDILRNQGVEIGKPDYMSSVGRYIRPKT